MKGKEAGYDKLTEFYKELQNIVLAHLQAEMPTVSNQFLKDSISSFITKITSDKNHPLYSQLEIIRLYNAILGELEKYLKELEFSRDLSTRESGIEFLTMVLNAIKIICTASAKEETVRINRKDYKIKGLNGNRSILTLWLVERPTKFANSLEGFHTKWEKFGVDKIIPKLDPLFSPRAKKEKKKNEAEPQEKKLDPRPLFLASPVAEASNRVLVPGGTRSEAELSDDKKKQEKTESTDIFSCRDAVLPGCKDSSSSSKVNIKRTPVKRNYKDADGYSIEEIMYEESLSDEGETFSEDESKAGYEEESKDSRLLVTPPHTPDKGPTHLKGLTGIKNSNPTLYNRLQSRYSDRSAFVGSEASVSYDEKNDLEGKPTQESPFSALLKETETFLNNQAQIGSTDETGLGDDDIHNPSAYRALTFSPSGNDDE